jgi:hypothetical protein
MKKVLLILIVLAQTLSAATAFAKTFEKKAEAEDYIREAIKDPEIKKYVNDNVGNEKLFIKALSYVSEDKVIEVANEFSDFQETGKGLTVSMSDVTVVIILLLLVIIIL